MTRSLLLGFTVAAASGCALAPGIRTNDSEMEDRAQAQGNPSFSVTPVTPAVIRKLAQEYVASLAARSPDPKLGDFKKYQYRIAPLDVIAVVVWDHPELTSPSGQFRSLEENGLPVYSDGTMFYPFVGYLPVAGKTVIDVQHELTRQLERAIKNPQVAVRVAAFRGKRVEVTGEVKAPQTLPVTDIPMRVSDAVSRAGGFVPESSPSNVTVLREGKAHHLDLMSFYEDGDVTQNWLLVDGDVVHVGHTAESSVYVFGEVKKMGTRPMPRGRLSLAQALGDSEGFDFATMRPAVYVLRDAGAGKPEIYRLDVHSGDALILAAHFPLKARDVVFVATSDMARFNRGLAQIIPLVNTIWQIWYISTTAKAIGP